MLTPSSPGSKRGVPLAKVGAVVSRKVWVTVYSVGTPISFTL